MQAKSRICDVTSFLAGRSHEWPQPCVHFQFAGSLRSEELCYCAARRGQDSSSDGAFLDVRQGQALYEPQPPPQPLRLELVLCKNLSVAGYTGTQEACSGDGS